MDRKIIQIGSSAAITIPPRILKALGVGAGDSMELTFNEARESITVRPSRSRADRRSKITSLTLDFVERYRDDLEALAK